PVASLRSSSSKELVADPYCGRGTTIYAARLRGLPSFGIDTSPVAVAVSRAKLVCTSLGAVMQAYDRLLGSVTRSTVPEGEFWDLGFHRETLSTLCRLRLALKRSLKERDQEEPGAITLLR